MARTYYAEGRKIANVLRGVFILLGLFIYFNIPNLHWIFFFIIIIGATIIAELVGALWTKKRREQKQSKRSVKTKKNETVANNTRSKQNKTTRILSDIRSDEMILSSKLSELNGAEFERLLALYFRDQGYAVKEVGVGGNDGGVDLVIIDKRGEKTAVQAKCYAEHNKVPVQTVRELVAAKRNHDCILSLLITTSDLTAPAKKEAEQFKVDYWHGAILEQKLKAWGKWRNNSSKNRSIVKNEAKTAANVKAEIDKAKKEVASTTNTKLCICGAPMVVRKNKQGTTFMGCSTFPKCRHTVS